MYCGRVQQAVVGRVVLLTSIPEKKQPFGGIIKFYGALSMRKSYVCLQLKCTREPQESFSWGLYRVSLHHSRATVYEYLLTARPALR